MRALVTGGAGFIGSHLVDLLIRHGHEVAVVDNLVTGTREQLSPAARCYEIDVVDPALTTVIAAESPTVVFHYAAQTSVGVSEFNPVFDASINALGLLNLLQACASARVQKVVYASSAEIYGRPEYLPLDEAHPQRPESPYGSTKLLGEHYLAYFAQRYGMRYTVLRLATVYGPRAAPGSESGIVSSLARQLLHGDRPVLHEHAGDIRDYLYIDDATQANLLAATAGDGRHYCIGTGVGTSVYQLYHALCEVLGILVPPIRESKPAGRPRVAYLDPSAARAELGWQPAVSLREGLRRSIRAASARDSDAALADWRGGTI